MSDKHETTADIIAEMRGIRVREFQDYADRLEAAHKRELSKNVSKNWADFGQLGDAAKLRGAVEESRRIASDLGGCRLNDYWKLNEIVRVCEAALAVPPRNCDVGTADDWVARFSIVCERCSGSDCDHRLFKDEEVCDCFARWAQMPYEGGAK